MTKSKYTAAHLNKKRKMANNIYSSFYGESRVHDGESVGTK